MDFGGGGFNAFGTPLLSHGFSADLFGFSRISKDFGCDLVDFGGGGLNAFGTPLVSHGFRTDLLGFSSISIDFDESFSSF